MPRPSPHPQKSFLPKKCLKALSLKMKSQQAQLGPWTLRPGKGQNGEVRFIYQSQLVGKRDGLLSLEKKKKVLYLTHISTNQTHFYKFTTGPKMPCSLRLLRVEKPTDRSEKAFKKGSAKPTRSKNSFFDSDLKTLLKNSKKGIIYIWSPHMPYSVGSLYPLKKMAKKWNIPLTVLMDPNAHDEETTKVIKQFSLPLNLTKKNKAKKLLFQGSSLHYPNYFFYSEGKLSPIQLFGAKGEEALNEVFKNISIKKRKHL